MKTIVEDIKNQWSSEGKRVILLARKTLKGHQTSHDPNDNSFEAEVMSQARTHLTLVGLVGIVDPPRDEIPEVVRILRRAGIRIFMVTGDFKLTAQAIAIECGIITNPATMVHDVSALSRFPAGSERTSASSVNEKENTNDRQTKDIEANDENTISAPAKSITLSGPELISLNDNQWDQLCSK